MIKGKYKLKIGNRVETNWRCNLITNYGTDQLFTNVDLDLTDNLLIGIGQTTPIATSNHIEGIKLATKDRSYSVYNPEDDTTTRVCFYTSDVFTEDTDITEIGLVKDVVLNNDTAITHAQLFSYGDDSTSPSAIKVYAGETVSIVYAITYFLSEDRPDINFNYEGVNYTVSQTATLLDQGDWAVPFKCVSEDTSSCQLYESAGDSDQPPQNLLASSTTVTIDDGYITFIIEDQFVGCFCIVVKTSLGIYQYQFLDDGAGVGISNETDSSFLFKIKLGE